MNKISVCFLLPLLAGCYWTGETIIPFPADQPQSPASIPVVTVQDQTSLQQRFSETEKMDPTQMITLWAQRYDELLKQNEQMRKESAVMSEQLDRLRRESARTSLDLDQTRKDLERSNALLQDAHVELSKWKSDVLGFREEMRQAQTAQLLALSKILRILGAEPVESQVPQTPEIPK